ncbi:unnamed protein product [Arabis nemorensis]|uniref:Uncharacterized protein n=1 Tax=Arabis nemorensis TaxID=586526 RepID=A0A565CMM3_9BRAS|nr:unnamed protein product [Arabis nemorensis]
MSAVLAIIDQSTVSSSSPLVQSCLNLLKDFVCNEDFSLSSGTLKMLIQFPMFVDLEYVISVESYVAPLSLIKAIVKKKVQVPEIYDIADQKRIEQHFSFLVNNLSYKHPTGRQAVLDVLQALIGKFSKLDDLGKQPVLDQQSEILFLELARRLATDDCEDVLSKTGDVIKLLVGRISKDKADSSLERCLVWYNQEDSQAIAAQVIGLFIEARKEAFRKRIRDILLQEAKTILESVVQLQDAIEEGNITLFWKKAFYTLVMIEKLLKQFPDLCFGKGIIWEEEKSEKLVADSLLEKPSSLFTVAASLCSQLKEHGVTRNKDDDTKREKIITDNIVFAVPSLHSLIEQSNHHHEFWSILDKDEQVVYLKAFELLDSGKGRSTFLALALGKRTANDVRNVLIGSLLKRMEKIALDTESLQMRIVFNVYKDFAKTETRRVSPLRL